MKRFVGSLAVFHFGGAWAVLWGMNIAWPPLVLGVFCLGAYAYFDYCDYVKDRDTHKDSTP